MKNFLKELIIIIPALAKNKYSDIGDLKKFGNITLLEWKIFQAKQIIPNKQIFVNSDNVEIKKICEKNSIQYLQRKKKLTLSEMQLNIGKKFSNKFTLWLNATSPFFDDKEILKFIKKSYLKLKKFDSIITCTLEKDYFFLKNKSINFNFKKKAEPRNKNVVLKKVTNSAYLLKGSTIIKSKNLFGSKPYFYPINFINSLEIKDEKNYNFHNLIFERKIKDL